MKEFNDWWKKKGTYIPSRKQVAWAAWREAHILSASICDKLDYHLRPNDCAAAIRNLYEEMK